MIKKQFVEIWGDIVEIRELVISMVLHIIFAFIGVILSPNQEYSSLLLCGLAGIMLASVLCSFLMKPKRQIHWKESSEED